MIESSLSRVDPRYNNMTVSQVDELVTFLDPGTAEKVAKPALEIIEGLSGSMEGIGALRPASAKLSNNLLLAIPRPSLSRSAATCLVNLSQDSIHCKALITASACSRLITSVVEGKTSDHDLVTMTLSNLTRSTEGAEQALQVAQGAVEKSAMRKLLSMALSPGTSDVLYEHVAGVLCNITQHRAGRDLLVESSLHGLKAVVQMLTSASDIKRTGAAAAIKNVVMSAKEDDSFEQIIQEPDMLLKILAPINGVAPIEREASVRENVALSIGIIAQDEAGRQVLFDIGAPEIVKKGYEFEENSDVMQAMECIGRLFLGVSGSQDDDTPVDSVVMVQ